jgi:dUTP pyrophosphatase
MYERNRIPVDLQVIERDRPFEFNLPEYKTPGSAGLDLVADIPFELPIHPGRRALINTGIAIHIENPNYVAFVVGRSGNGINHGIHLSQGFGVLDSDYTGEVMIPLTNSDPEKVFHVKPGDRIAQLLLLPVVSASFNIVKDLKETTRGAGGFGSTGRQ